MRDSVQLPELIILGQHIDLFWVGVFGSVAVELTTFAGHYDKGAHPEKYKKVGFWISKTVLALCGGGLVEVYGVTTAPAARWWGGSGCLRWRARPWLRFAATASSMSAPGFRP